MLMLNDVKNTKVFKKLINQLKILNTCIVALQQNKFKMKNEFLFLNAILQQILDDLKSTK